MGIPNLLSGDRSPCPQSLGAIPGLSAVFAGEAPEFGIQDSKLSPCSSTPNCVVSQGDDADHSITPIAYTVSRDKAREVLTKVLRVVPRTEIVTQQENYIRVRSISRILGFVDDTEFYFPEDEPVIHVQAAARLGESDLGVNRRRLEQIRFASGCGCSLDRALTSSLIEKTMQSVAPLRDGEVPF